MFFRKKKEEPRVCTGCGCLIARQRGKEVTQDILRDNYDTAFITYFSEPLLLFYCGRCTPPYDQITIPSGGGNRRYFVRVIEHYEEVDEEGKPLKKKK
ncbi:hypothetical protein LCGC14_1747810 [marine sediment metagenome]|uniref:Uncharacterized protein n=1 Tax=marine sediment metagenome TaxID=412755 RepID=A0A0F9K469_9ZZZZ